MITFTQWLEQNTLGTEEVDSSQIERLYDKAKISVELVQKYDQTLPQDEKLLLRINTILPLSSGVYGLYMSGENKSVIAPDVLNKLKLNEKKEIIFVDDNSNDGTHKLLNYLNYRRVCAGTLGGPIGWLWVASSYGVWVLRT